MRAKSTANQSLPEQEKVDLAAQLKASLILFTQYFYKIRTGREYAMPNSSRPSHYKEVARSLVRAQRGETNRLIINIPPRYGKTELCIHFVAWSLARYPDANFIYVSYAHKLASKQTQTIRQIMNLPQYKDLFDVHITKESSAKDNFETTDGGSVYACGSGGTITGRGAGVANVDRFGGAIIIDDIHKPAEVTSDTMRESVNDWYFNTLISRVNSPSTPFVFIGQRLHEDDLAGNLINKKDGYEWDKLILPALDERKVPLCPTIQTQDALLTMQETMPYEFASQYQQNPQPAGGGIFKSEWFPLLDFEPDFDFTFLTADTAETDKTYNDATVLSFWGAYKIKINGQDTGVLGLHWIDCLETWVEPKDLKTTFLNFYTECMRHKVKPTSAAIEKKSTGTTLVSLLKDVQGLNVIEIERSKSSGSKIERFLRAQPYVAQKLITFTWNAKHTKTCIEHMRKITANNTHRNDDIADTCADAIQLALIDKSIAAVTHQPVRNDKSWQAVTKVRF